ncbi:MAG TPA: nuclear transport factor 2 family protein [Nitrososphaerales archaeon]|nr:nuclear transport factor 2 family protein [Nitrososphaerales archaeon]
MQRESEDTKHVRETMQRIYSAFEELDAEKLDANFSHSDELLAFGTDWDEKFVGWNAYKDVHTVQFKAVKSFNFTSRELDVHVYDGIAWVADRPHWKIETKAGERLDEDMRITAVLKKDMSGAWLVVQWHVSVGLRERLHEY